MFRLVLALLVGGALAVPALAAENCELVYINDPDNQVVAPSPAYPFEPKVIRFESNFDAIVYSGGKEKRLLNGGSAGTGIAMMVLLDPDDEKVAVTYTDVDLSAVVKDDAPTSLRIVNWGKSKSEIFWPVCDPSFDYDDIRVGVQGNRVMLDDRGGEWEYAFFDIERYAKPNAPAFFLWLAGDLFWPVCDDPSYASKVIEAQANIEKAKAETK